MAIFSVPSIMIPDPPPATISFTDSATSASDLTTYTFSSLSIGAADASRKVIVAAVGQSSSASRTFSSVTVAGVTATAAYKVELSNRAVGLYIADVPTGTTGNVVVTWSGAQDSTGVGVWRTTLLTSSTVVDTTFVTAVTTTVNYPSLTTNDGGVSAFVCLGQGTLSTYTWGTSTENYDETIESAISQTGASGTTDGSSISEVITCSATGLKTAIGASWR